MTPQPLRRTAVVLLAATLLAAACSDPPPEKRLLVIDGIQIDLADVEPYVRFYDSFLPEGGPKTKVQRVLDEHVLPLRLARRAFPAERQAQREQAEALCSVATNVAELQERAKLLPEDRQKVSNLTRMHAQLPVAMFLFDPLLRGSVSQPIETPTGWFVAGCLVMHESPLALDDYCEALQIGFVTHSATEWREWIETTKQQIAGKATFVHPDYRTAMPSWIQLPKQP